MSTWREHELNFLEQGQRCEIIVANKGRHEAFWDATFRFFWIYCPREEPVILDNVKEWRPI